MLDEENDIIIDLRDFELEEKLKKQKEKQFQNIKFSFIFLVIGMLVMPILYAFPDCNEGLKYFDGNCYDCDGILYQRVNGNIVCIKCAEGFEYDLQGGCKPKELPQERDVGTFLDKISSKISPENPLIGFIILFILLIIIVSRLFKKKFR